MSSDPPRPRIITLTPAGVLGSIALLVVVLGCVRLGFWQLERLQQRRALNAAVAARLAEAPVSDVAALADTAGAAYRTITVSGVLDNGRSIVLPGRSYRGTPGVHLLTPLRLDSRSDAVLVNRGWIPSADAATVEVDSFAVPGAVTVTGLVLPFPSHAQSLAQREPPPQDQPAFRRIWFSIDPVALRAQFPYTLLPAVVQQLPSAADAPRYPIRLGAPPLDGGPHLGYAVQWFSFALIGVIGWIALVRGRSRPRVRPPAVVAAALLALAPPATGAAQLRPVDPLEWQVYEPATFIVTTAGIGALWEQQATLAGTRGRLLEIGNYRITFRIDRMAVELAGTALWRMTDEVSTTAPAAGVRPPDGSPRQEPGFASAATLVNLTPRGSPIDVVVRFGARIPTTSDESGLDRDRTDFFALAAARFRTGRLALTAENGVGIHGTAHADYPQSDVWAYAFGAEYGTRRVSASAQLVGHQDGHGWRVRGNEDLRELRFGATVGSRRSVGVTYIRGLSDWSPTHGLRIVAGFTR